MNPIDHQRRRTRSSAQGGAPSAAVATGQAANQGPGLARPAVRLGLPANQQAAASPPLRPAAQPVLPVHPADLQQAAYVVAREAVGRPLTEESKALLWTANETRKEVLELLPLGRGNIESDLQTSGGHSRPRAVALRLLQGTLPFEGIAVPHQRAMQAAFATRAGAGNCAEFAEVSAHVHAKHLSEGDRIVRQQIDNLDHGWARVQSATPVGGEPCSGPAAILDVWADGPIVEPTDSRHGSGRPRETHDSLRIDGADAASIVEAFEMSRGSGLDGLATQLAVLSDMIKSGATSAPLMYFMDPIPVVSPGFAYSARNAIDRTSPTTLQASAVDALLEATTPVTREQAEAHAGTVVALAKNLDRPAPEARNVFRPIGED